MAQASSANLSLSPLTLAAADPLSLFDAAAAGGFTQVGLRLLPPSGRTLDVPIIGDEALIRRILDRKVARGIAVFDIEAVWLTSDICVADLEEMLDVAARLGARTLLVAGVDDDQVRLTDNLSALDELAAPVGVSLSLEPMSFLPLRTLEQAVTLVGWVNRPNVGLLVDALHFFRSGSRLETLERVAPGRIHYAQLCDGGPRPIGNDALREEAKANRRYPGLGQLPLDRFIQALPPAVTITIEAPSADHVHLPFDVQAQLCGEASRAVLERNGR